MNKNIEKKLCIWKVGTIATKNKHRKYNSDREWYANDMFSGGLKICDACEGYGKFDNKNCEKYIESKKHKSKDMVLNWLGLEEDYTK